MTESFTYHFRHEPCFRPLHATFGAEVLGVDLSRDVDAATLAEIEAAWQRYSILLFRDVDMTPAQHVAFTRRLGPLHIMEPLEFNLPGYPEVLVVVEHREGQQADRHEARRLGLAFRRRGQGAAERGLVHPRDQAAAGRRRHDVRRHLCRVRRAARRRAREDHGTPRVLQPRALPRGLLPASAAADRRAEKGASGRLATDRAPASEVRLDVALHRTLGVQDRRHARRRGAGADRLPEGLRDAAASSSTATSGASATRCCGTTAARSIARRRSTTRSISGTCSARRSKAKCRSWRSAQSCVRRPRWSDRSRR